MSSLFTNVLMSNSSAFQMIGISSGHMDEVQIALGMSEEPPVKSARA